MSDKTHRWMIPVPGDHPIIEICGVKDARRALEEMAAVLLAGLACNTPEAQTAAASIVTLAKAQLAAQWSAIAHAVPPSTSPESVGNAIELLERTKALGLIENAIENAIVPHGEGAANASRVGKA